VWGGETDDYLTLAKANILATQMTEDKVAGPGDMPTFWANTAQSREVNPSMIDGNSTMEDVFRPTDGGSVPDETVETIVNDVIWVLRITQAGPAAKPIALQEGSVVYGVIGDHVQMNNKDVPLLYDPIAAMASSKGDDDDHQIEYESEYVTNSVMLKFKGNIAKLLTSQSYDSMKLFATIMAAQENGRVKGAKNIEQWLGELGFTGIEPFETDGDLIDNATGWFATLSRENKPDIVLVFVQGTDGWLQWFSDVNLYSVTNNKNGNAHDGFWQAKGLTEKALASYLKRQTLSPDDVFFALCGYSRGAGIVDLMAAGSTLAGATLSSNNYLAYTFGTPDTIRNKQGGNVSRITNVVSGKDPFDHILPNWTKNGQTVGYDYDQDVIDQFYGENTIAENWDMGRGHRAENLIANVFTSEPKLEYKRGPFGLWRWVRIHCLTNVYVYNRDGELVASVIDNVAESRDPDVYIATTDDGQKDVLFPRDGGYQIEIEATGDDTMQVGSDLIGADTQQTEFNELKSFDIVNKEVYEVDLDTGELKPSDGKVNFKISSSTSDDSKKITWVIGGLAVLFVIIMLIFVATGPMRRRKTSNS
jgi:hypothetical protein